MFRFTFLAIVRATNLINPIIFGHDCLPRCRLPACLSIVPASLYTACHHALSCLPPCRLLASVMTACLSCQLPTCLSIVPASLSTACLPLDCLPLYRLPVSMMNARLPVDFMPCIPYTFLATTAYLPLHRACFPVYCLPPCPQLPASLSTACLNDDCLPLHRACIPVYCLPPCQLPVSMPTARFPVSLYSLYLSATAACLCRLPAFLPLYRAYLPASLSCLPPAMPASLSTACLNSILMPSSQRTARTSNSWLYRTMTVLLAISMNKLLVCRCILAV